KGQRVPLAQERGGQRLGSLLRLVHRSTDDIRFDSSRGQKPKRVLRAFETSCREPAERGTFAATLRASALSRVATRHTKRSAQSSGSASKRADGSRRRSASAARYDSRCVRARARIASASSEFGSSSSA